MLKKCLAVLAVLPLLLLTGCIENGTMLLVNKDGSGKIITRIYMNDTMGGLGGLAGAFGAEEGVDAEALDMTAAFKEGLENAAESFGEDVELEGIKEVKNKLGWKGYEGTYTFKDVSKVKFQGAPMDAAEDGGGGAGGMGMDTGDMAYTLKFTPGDTATLEIVADLPEDALNGGGDAAGDADAAADALEELGGPNAKDMANPAMMAMMAPMLQGMRISMMVKVNGDIVETNGKYVNEKMSSVLVMDMRMDKLMANQEAMKLMMADEGKGSEIEQFEKLEAMNVDGFKMHNPMKPLKISFK